jgi:hypothetical protein
MRFAFGGGAILAAAVIATGAWAQTSAPAPAQTTTPAPAPMVAYHGQVVSLTGNQLSIMVDGKAETFELADQPLVILNQAGTLASIKPGDYIATTNAQRPDGSGVSVSLSIYEPGMGKAGVNYLMPTGNMMTNGNVAKIVANPGSSTLQVDYGKGVRTVEVPAGSAIILASRGTPAALVPGVKVTVRAAADPAGKRIARIITVGVGGMTPA